jgi:pilus assembly protein Flp/PilA
MDLLIRFLHNEAGASAVEYALLLGLIALAIVGSVTTFGISLRDSFQTSTTKMFGSGGG